MDQGVGRDGIAGYEPCASPAPFRDETYGAILGAQVVRWSGRGGLDFTRRLVAVGCSKSFTAGQEVRRRLNLKVGGGIGVVAQAGLGQQAKHQVFVQEFSPGGGRGDGPGPGRSRRVLNPSL